jgi:hypothetical protein
MKNQLKSVELFLVVGVATTITLSGGGIVNASEYDNSNSTQEESATSNIYLLAQEEGTQEEGTQEEGGEGGEGTHGEGTHEEGTHEEGGEEGTHEEGTHEEGGEGGEGV